MPPPVAIETTNVPVHPTFVCSPVVLTDPVQKQLWSKTANFVWLCVCVLLFWDIPCCFEFGSINTPPPPPPSLGQEVVVFCVLNTRFLFHTFSLHFLFSSSSSSSQQIVLSLYLRCYFCSLSSCVHAFDRVTGLLSSLATSVVNWDVVGATASKNYCRNISVFYLTQIINLSH